MKILEILAAAIYRAEAEPDASVSGRPVDWENERVDIRQLYIRDAEVALAALGNQGYAVEPGWRCIELAPPAADCTCLLYFPETEGSSRIRIGSLAEAVGRCRPSHWRPLPSPPDD